MKSIRALSVAFTALFLFSASSARADDLYVWVEQVGNDVVFRFAGSIDLTGFPAPSPGNGSSFMDPLQGDVFFGGLFQSYSPMIPETQPFGLGGSSLPDSTSGSPFGVAGNVLAVPNSYVSKTPISGSMTFLSTDLAMLGVNTTPYTIQTTVGDNTIHMFTDPADVAAAAAAAAAKAATRADLLRKIKKLQKKAKKLKKKGKKAKAKKLLKKVKKLKQQLTALG